MKRPIKTKTAQGTWAESEISGLSILTLDIPIIHYIEKSYKNECSNVQGSV